jgi:ABC-type uncharacterized transport system substrate-binding protein
MFIKLMQILKQRIHEENLEKTEHQAIQKLKTTYSQLIVSCSKNIDRLFTAVGSSISFSLFPASEKDSKK